MVINHSEINETGDGAVNNTADQAELSTRITASRVVDVQQGKKAAGVAETTGLKDDAAVFDNIPSAYADTTAVAQNSQPQFPDTPAGRKEANEYAANQARQRAGRGRVQSGDPAGNDTERVVNILKGNKDGGRMTEQERQAAEDARAIANRAKYGKAGQGAVKDKSVEIAGRRAEELGVPSIITDEVVRIIKRK
ncbi:MAG: hypothetical protein K8F91_26785 [Candidatus Obscuribacterales bacterium]|nr:hypothetical protein [Candidatus Obscuribacterales bacterium]